MDQIIGRAKAFQWTVTMTTVAHHRQLPLSLFPDKPMPRRCNRAIEFLWVHHYNRCTEQTYVHRVRRHIEFHREFHRHRHPREVAEDDVSRSLISLAVRQQIAGATQNQALSAVRFLYIPQTLARKHLDANRAWCWRYAFSRENRWVNLRATEHRTTPRPRITGAECDQAGCRKRRADHARHAPHVRAYVCHTALGRRVTHSADGYGIRAVSELLSDGQVKSTIICTRLLNRGGVASAVPRTVLAADLQ